MLKVNNDECPKVHDACGLQSTCNTTTTSMHLAYPAAILSGGGCVRDDENSNHPPFPIQQHRSYCFQKKAMHGGWIFVVLVVTSFLSDFTVVGQQQQQQQQPQAAVATAIFPLRQSIRALLHQEPFLGPKFLRLAFHSALGGIVNGCVDVTDPDNWGIASTDRTVAACCGRRSDRAITQRRLGLGRFRRLRVCDTKWGQQYDGVSPLLLRTSRL